MLQNCEGGTIHNKILTIAGLVQAPRQFIDCKQLLPENYSLSDKEI